MVFLRDINSIREVKWGKPYLWDIKFIDSELPTPFNEWFPANTVEFLIGGVVSSSQEFFMGTYSYPMSMPQRTLAITCYDDEQGSIEAWMDKWIKETIFNKGQYVTPLLDCIKMVQLVKLTRKREEIQGKSTWSLWVYPDGNLNFSGQSVGDVVQHNLNFIVVGETE